MRNSSQTVPGNAPPARSGAWKAGLSYVAAGAALPLAILVLWQLAGSLGYLSPVFLPTPLAIAASFADLAESGLAHHLGVSLGRAAIGFAVGGGAGLLLGILAGLIKKAEYLLDPSIQTLRVVPHLAIVPLIILWFGFGEVSKVFIIASGAFFPLYVNAFMGIRNVDNKLFDVAKVLEFNAYKRFVRLILPAAAPAILLGVRLSMGVAWIGLVVAELVGSTAGVGFLMNEAKQNGETVVIFVGIIIFAVVGKLIDSLVRLMERKWLQWRDSYKG